MVERVAACPTRNLPETAMKTNVLALGANDVATREAKHKTPRLEISAMLDSETVRAVLSKFSYSTFTAGST